jgi:hypothetical protein
MDQHFKQHILMLRLKYHICCSVVAACAALRHEQHGAGLMNTTNLFNSAPAVAHLRQIASKSLDTSCPRTWADSNLLLLLLLLGVSWSLHWASLLLASGLGLHQDLLSAKRMNSSPYQRALGAPVLRWRQPVSHTTQLHGHTCADTG